LTWAFGWVSIARSNDGRSRRFNDGAGSLRACLCCTFQIRAK
jgi:hypothetical protein